MTVQKEQRYDINYYADLIGKTDRMIDPVNGLSYHREGEVWIPDIALEPELTEDEWDELRDLVCSLYQQHVLHCTLWTHMKDIQEQAQNRLDTMIPRMAAEQGVTEELKKTDLLCWVGMMNNIRHSVEETIYADLIYA